MQKCYYNMSVLVAVLLTLEIISAQDTCRYVEIRVHGQNMSGFNVRGEQKPLCEAGIKSQKGCNIERVSNTELCIRHDRNASIRFKNETFEGTLMGACVEDHNGLSCTIGNHPQNPAEQVSELPPRATDTSGSAVKAQPSSAAHRLAAASVPVLSALLAAALLT